MKKPDMMTLKHEAILANWMYVISKNVAGQVLPTDFYLSTNDIVSVKKELVSEEIISASLPNRITGNHTDAAIHPNIGFWLR